MKKMTALAASALMAATALGAVAMPTAASAQVSIRFGAPGFWTPERSGAIRNQIWRLDTAIARADQRNTITNREARMLRRDSQALRTQYNRYARDGLTTREVNYLQSRVNNIRTKLRMSRLDWDREDYWRGNKWRGDRDGDGLPNHRDPHPNRPH